MRQKANLGHWTQAGGALWAALRVALMAAVLATPAAGVSPSSEQTGNAPGDPSVEAFLARGISRSTGSEMRAGLADLRSAVRLEPGNTLARKSLAIALLRAGRFGEAEVEFTAGLGEESTRALSSGQLSSADLSGSTDADALLGLATSVQFQGRVREAERLYRVYADLAGALSKDAGRAYFRLHELATESGVEWLDAEAELAKALAVDPDIRSAALLPAFIDPTTRPELEPYLRPIELSGSRVDSTVEYDTLPLLSRWTAPADTSEMLLALAEGKLQLEILVGADGFPDEVIPVTPVTDEDLTPLTSAVGAWRFTPARTAGEDAPAWILFGKADEAEPDDQESSDREPDDEGPDDQKPGDEKQPRGRETGKK